MAKTKYAPMDGAEKFGKNLTLPDIWVALHDNADAWNRAAFAADKDRQRLRLDEGALSLLGTLENVPVQQWQALCGASGLTAYGAIAASWCKDADIAQIAPGWFALVLPHLETPVAVRTARLVSPPFRIIDRSLSSIIAAAPRQLSLMCLYIMSSASRVDLDVAHDLLEKAPLEVARVLLSQVPDQAETSTEIEILRRINSVDT